MVSFTPRPLYLKRKEPPVSVVYEARWAPKPLWTRRQREKIPSLPLPGIESQS